MFTDKKITYKTAQPYIAIRKIVAQQNIPAELPPLVEVVAGWLQSQNLSEDGDMFFTYLGMDKNNLCIAEVGFPVNRLPDNPALPEGFVAGTFVSGDYASLVYSGDYTNMMDAHIELDTFIKSEERVEETSLDPSNEVYGSRTEYYLNDCNALPDPADWQTRIEVLLRAV